MESNEIFNRINSLHGNKQERLYLEQKHRNFKIDYDLIVNLLNEDTLDKIDSFIVEEHQEYLNANKLEGIEEHSKETKDLDEFKKSYKIKLVDLYDIIVEPTLMNTILKKYFFKIKEFNFDGKKYSFDELVETNQISKIKQAHKIVEKEILIIMDDLDKRGKLKKEIEGNENGSIEVGGNTLKTKVLSDSLQKELFCTMLEGKREERDDITDFDDGKDGMFSEYELDVLGIKDDKIRKSLSNNVSKSGEIKNMAWQYNFFNFIKNMASEYGYILTPNELDLIYSIVEDFKNNKVVMLTGNTGSGKTELSGFLCKVFLKSEFEFISGSKDLETSDFTSQREVQTKAYLENNEHVILGKENMNDKANQVKDFVNSVISTEEFKKEAVEYCEDDESKKMIETALKETNLLEKHLNTEHHRMSLYSAMVNGTPLIIDEVNLIRPEVFMALNDLLTKKTGDVVKTEDSLPNIKVKEGFGIILTGNDPDQNSDSGAYKRRYQFDEASYNRLRVYSKDYFNHKEKDSQEHRGEGIVHLGVSEDVDLYEEEKKKIKEFAYMEDNELYNVLLMFGFNLESDYTKTGKYGYEVMKKDDNGDYLDKNKYFESMRMFANFIHNVQMAFDNKLSILNDMKSEKGFNLSDNVFRAVFSMRNLKDVMQAYKKSSMPLEYYIYKEFIDRVSNKKEKYALLVIAERAGFFSDQVTDNIDKTISNINKKIKVFEQDTKNTSKGEKKIKIKKEDLKNRIVITKNDLMKEYFQSFQLSDDFFNSLDEEKLISDNSSSETDETDDIDVNHINTGINIDPDVIRGNIDALIENLQKNDQLFSLYNVYSSMLYFFRDKIKILNQKDLNNFNKLISTLLNNVDDLLSKDEQLTELEINQLSSKLSKLGDLL